MTRKHTNEPKKCQQDCIQEIVELCDNEYYMSAIGPPVGSRERAERGYRRIKQWLHELEGLKSGVKCIACCQEIDLQIALQRKVLQDIESVWDIR